MKNEKRDKAREQNGSLDGQYRFKALWRMAALINLGGMPLGHIDDNHPLPYLVQARLDGEKGQLVILEAAVE